MSTAFTRLAFGAGLVLLSPWSQGQVTYMSNVPTVQELKAALALSRSQPAAPDATAPAGRGIEFTAAMAAPTAAPGKVLPPASETGGNAAQVTTRPNAGPAVAMPINFDVNSSRLTSVSGNYVNVVANLLAQDPTLKLAIEGHTDANGDVTRNLMLSWDRAMAVFKTLVEKHGVDPQRLQPVGRGSLEPLEGMSPVAPTNRRVQFRVIG